MLNADEFELQPLVGDEPEFLSQEGATDHNEFMEKGLDVHGLGDSAALSKAELPPHRELGSRMIEFSLPGGRKARITRERFQSCNTDEQKRQLDAELYAAVGL
jgi:hypothetical protein